jgi:prepilin-type N-terminal cleavage/methylation domain-containing protein
MDTKNKDKGFTLVELLIVIVILGILATVTVFAVRGITDQGQTSACAADEKTMEVAVEAWIAQNGLGDPLNPVYPTEADLTPDFLRSESDNFNTSGGAVTADAAGKCA